MSAAHMLFKCRFSLRIWNAVKSWIGASEIDTTAWQTLPSVHAWWEATTLRAGHRRHAMIMLLMLVVWDLWKERNARVFGNKSTMSSLIIDHIKNEAKDWIFAQAKHVGDMP